MSSSSKPSNHRHESCGFFGSVGSLVRPHQFFVPIDQHSIWRRHLIWAKHDGDALRDLMTQRFASNMVFVSLLLGSNITVLFSPSTPSEIMRQKLVSAQYSTVDFWAGLVLSASIFLCLCTLIATFTAWAVISSISGPNAHAILRSSVGLFAAQLPSRCIVLAIYSFLIWTLLFMFILLPRVWAIVVTTLTCLLLLLIVSTYNTLGALVMQTSAMGSKPVFEKREEDKMLPNELYYALLDRARDRSSDLHVSARSSLAAQYMSRRNPSRLQGGSENSLSDMEDGISLQQTADFAQDTTNTEPHNNVCRNS